MNIADIRIITNLLKHNTDLQYVGWVHPQIDPTALMRTIWLNYDLTEAPEYSVVVESPSGNIVGPYTFDVAPLGEYKVAELLDNIEETKSELRRIYLEQEEAE